MVSLNLLSNNYDLRIKVSCRPGRDYCLRHISLLPHLGIYQIYKWINEISARRVETDTEVKFDNIARLRL